MTTEFNWSWVDTAASTLKESGSISKKHGTIYSFTQAKNGQVRASDLNSFVRSTAQNLQDLRSNWTTYTRPLLDSLPAGGRDTRWANLSSKVDAITYGLQGTTLFVFNDATSSKAEGRYWHTTDSRPKTIAETFEDFWDALSDIETSASSTSSSDLDPVWAALGEDYRDGDKVVSSGSLDTRVTTAEGHIQHLATDIYTLSGSSYGLSQALLYSVAKNIDELLKAHGVSGGWQEDPSSVTHTGVGGGASSLQEAYEGGDTITIDATRGSTQFIVPSGVNASPVHITNNNSINLPASLLITSNANQGIDPTAAPLIALQGTSAYKSIFATGDLIVGGSTSSSFATFSSGAAHTVIDSVTTSPTTMWAYVYLKTNQNNIVTISQAASTGTQAVLTQVTGDGSSIASVSQDDYSVTFNSGNAYGGTYTVKNHLDVMHTIHAAGAHSLFSKNGEPLGLIASDSGEIQFQDGNRTGSTWGNLYVKLSDSTAEWDLYEANFGETSLFDAINQAHAGLRSDNGIDIVYGDDTGVLTNDQLKIYRDTNLLVDFSNAGTVAFTPEDDQDFTVTIGGTESDAIFTVARDFNVDAGDDIWMEADDEVVVRYNAGASTNAMTIVNAATGSVETTVANFSGAGAITFNAYTDQDFTVNCSGTGVVDVSSADVKLKLYSQDAEPTLTADNTAALWKDTNDSNKIYLVFRRASADQVKIELT